MDFKIPCYSTPGHCREAGACHSPCHRMAAWQSCVKTCRPAPGKITTCQYQGILGLIKYRRVKREENYRPAPCSKYRGREWGKLVDKTRERNRVWPQCWRLGPSCKDSSKPEKPINTQWLCYPLEEYSMRHLIKLSSSALARASQLERGGEEPCEGGPHTPAPWGKATMHQKLSHFTWNKEMLKPFTKMGENREACSDLCYLYFTSPS